TGESWQEELVTPDQAKLMQEILRSVVTDGTAKAAKRDDLEISGKTGTAELKSSSDKKGKENGWFIGYPTKDQDILVSMMIENVENKGASSFVAEHVADILEKVKKSTP